jgi:hypothetical protein
MIGNFNPQRDPTLAAAIRAYGQPSSRRRLDRTACDVRWSARGVRILFADFGGGVACNPGSGKAQSAVISGNRPWRTGQGLRLRDPVGELRRLYPRAKRHGRLFWLRTGFTVIGTARRYPVLAARIVDGQVASFELEIGAAGD